MVVVFPDSWFMNGLFESLEASGVPVVSQVNCLQFALPPEKFYYMSYGSNMLMERFMCYLAGGKPLRSSRVYLGARDASAPVESFGVVFEGSVYYANSTSVWGGGGFLFADFDAPKFSLGRVHLVTPKFSLGRVHLVTREQFVDVVSQECGFEAGSVAVDFVNLLKDGQLVDEGLLYGKTVYVGMLEGVPVVSFTTRFSEREVASGAAPFGLNPPSDAYRQVVHDGLVDTFSLDENIVEEYLNHIEGIF